MLHRHCVRVSTLLLFALPMVAQVPDLSGTWFSNRGVLQVQQQGNDVTARYGDQDACSLSGTRAGNKIEFTAKEGRAELTGTLEFDAGAHRFTGDWKSANGKGSWRGWRSDPALQKGKPAAVAGHWRTSWGMLELEQSGSKLKGGLGAQGFYSVDGEVKGRSVKLDYDSPFGTGTFAFDVEADGKIMLGSAAWQRGQSALQAQRLEGHARKPAPKAGVIVDAIAANRLVYYLRAPKGYKAGQKLPLLVILHGSNYCSRPYVESIGNTDVGERCLVVGIDGESWVDASEPSDPRQNYTYASFTGRSTYKGYPHTDRESPALCAELLRDLQQQLQPTRTFVGGHSQGGFLTWFLAMHFPELVDGVFPMSCGMVFQCEPDAFDDQELMRQQRQVAIAVVHGENDPNVPFAQGRGTFESCEEHGFPRLSMFANKAGHGFSSLRWHDAVEWLEAMTSDDPAVLTKFANDAIDDDRFRDATAAIARLRARKPVPAAAASLARRIDEYAATDAARFAKAIAEPGDGGWIDDFLAFRRNFEFADCSAEVMQQFAALRAQHEAAARQLLGEARQLFQQNRRDDGWAKYEELVDKHWPSSLYARVKGWLAERR